MTDTITETEIEEIAGVLFDEFRCLDNEDGSFEIEQGCTWMIDDQHFVWRDCRVEGPSLQAVENMFWALEAGQGELRESEGERYIFYPVFPPEGFLFSGENEKERVSGTLTAFCWFL